MVVSSESVTLLFCFCKIIHCIILHSGHGRLRKTGGGGSMGVNVVTRIYKHFPLIFDIIMYTYIYPVIQNAIIFWYLWENIVFVCHNVIDCLKIMDAKESLILNFSASQWEMWINMPMHFFANDQKLWNVQLIWSLLRQKKNSCDEIHFFVQLHNTGKEYGYGQGY